MDKEKWKRLADAFAGKYVPDIQRESAGQSADPVADLPKMARKLMEITEEQWGEYAFSRDPLEGKFDREQKREYTKKASDCGKEWADRYRTVYRTSSPEEIARKMGVTVLTPDEPVGGSQVIFAKYVQPDEITVYMDCVRRASGLKEESGCGLLEKETLFQILLSHELFHAVEYRHEKEIYTRTERVELWRKPFSNRSPIACLSEIAAMAFGKELLGLNGSPYVLDVLLVYAYDKKAAWRLYKEILTLTTE